MRAWFGLTACLGCLVASAPAGAAAIDWSGLPYFTPASPRLILSTDGSWDGARVVDTGASLGGWSYVGFERTTRNFIWGPSCGRALEQRTFKKTFLAPGAPVRGTFNLAYTYGRDRPFESATMSVNGVEVVRLPRTAGQGVRVSPYRMGDVPAAALAAFRYGENTVTITATKAKLKRGQRCNDPRVPRHVGVMGDLNLEFASDLRVNPPVLQQEVYRNVVNKQVVGVLGSTMATNLGPSAALRGQLLIQALGDGSAVVSTLNGVPGEPFQDCGVGQDSAMLTCRFTDFQAGVSARVPILAVMTVDTSRFRNGAGRLRIQVGLITDTGIPTINNSDDIQEKVVVLCTAAATDPACR